MIAFSIGVVMAITLAIFAQVTKFDRDRSFFATLLIVIATYYILFSLISFEAVLTEIVIASVFSLMAIAGAIRWPILIGLGILAHGIFDFTHMHLINNSGVPEWWPAFCGGFDIIFGGWVLYLVKFKKGFAFNGT